MKNYTSEGRWRYDGFKKFEEEMIKREKMAINNLSALPLRKCMAFATKLDIATAGSKVNELQNSLEPFYLEGRALLEANEGKQLRKIRLDTLKRFKNLVDKGKIGVSVVRSFAES